MSFILVRLFQNSNSCNAYLLMIYIVRKQIYHSVVLQWTFSAVNLLVLWRCSCSWSAKVCVESVSYIYCSFWGPTECSTADICWRDPWICAISWRTEGSCAVPSIPVLTSWSKQIHLTVRSALLTFVSIASFYNCHFAVKITKAHATHLARDRLQLTARSSYDRSFIAKGFNRYVFRG